MCSELESELESVRLFYTKKVDAMTRKHETQLSHAAAATVDLHQQHPHHQNNNNHTHHNNNNNNPNDCSELSMDNMSSASPGDLSRRVQLLETELCATAEELGRAKASLASHSQSRSSAHEEHTHKIEQMHAAIKDLEATSRLEAESLKLKCASQVRELQQELVSRDQQVRELQQRSVKSLSDAAARHAAEKENLQAELALVAADAAVPKTPEMRQYLVHPPT